MTPLVPVVIGTAPDRNAWLHDCLTSIRTTSARGRRVHIHRNGGFEPAAIRAGCEKFKRFLFLQDSATILDPAFWTVIDQSGPAWVAGPPHMHLAIYEAAAILPLLPTEAVTKDQSIHLESDIPTRLHMPMLWPDVIDTTHLRHETRHGRDNLVLGNSLFEKHKGSWGQ